MFLGGISVTESVGLSSTTWPQRCQIQYDGHQNGGHYAVQGHSMSEIFVPIESTYVTSC